MGGRPPRGSEPTDLALPRPCPGPGAAASPSACATDTRAPVPVRVQRRPQAHRPVFMRSGPLSRFPCACAPSVRGVEQPGMQALRGPGW